MLGSIAPNNKSFMLGSIAPNNFSRCSVAWSVSLIPGVRILPVGRIRDQRIQTGKEEEAEQERRM
jgi:hypothetical protein